MNKDEEGEAFFITKIYSQENEYYYPLEWIINDQPNEGKKQGRMETISQS